MARAVLHLFFIECTLGARLKFEMDACHNTIRQRLEAMEKELPSSGNQICFNTLCPLSHGSVFIAPRHVIPPTFCCKIMACQSAHLQLASMRCAVRFPERVKQSRNAVRPGPMTPKVQKFPYWTLQMVQTLVPQASASGAWPRPRWRDDPAS